MKRISLLFLAISCCITVAAQKAGELPSHTFKSGGIERTYKLYIPDNLAEDSPLVFVLHGYGASADPDRYGMNPVAGKYGFAVCYPQGERDGRGSTCWNVGYPFQSDMAIDDVEYLCSLAGYLQEKHHLSRRNTFCTGLSNGGEMCYLLAYKRPDVFSAVAPVAGLTLEWMYRELDAQKPVPLLEIHGTEDKTSLWNGDPENTGGWGNYIAVPLAVGYWAARAGCTHEVRDTITTQVQSPPGGRIIRHKYVNGTGGCQVWLYEIEGGGHSWTVKDMDTAEHVWNFFSKFVTKN